MLQDGAGTADHVERNVAAAGEPRPNGAEEHVLPLLTVGLSASRQRHVFEGVLLEELGAKTDTRRNPHAAFDANHRWVFVCEVHSSHPI